MSSLATCPGICEVGVWDPLPPLPGPSMVLSLVHRSTGHWGLSRCRPGKHELARAIFRGLCQILGLQELGPLFRGWGSEGMGPQVTVGGCQEQPWKGF